MTWAGTASREAIAAGLSWPGTATAKVDGGSTPAPAPTPTPTPSTGYDIILARTDSLGNGVYEAGAQDVDVANVFQWRTRAPTGISADITPLDSGTPQANQPAANPYSPLNSMAKAYTARTGRKVLIMLHGYNGSGYNNGIWSPGGQYHEEFITRALVAVAGAQAQDATSKVVAIVEIIATNDATMTKANFKAAKLSAMADVRQRVPGAMNAPYLHVAQMPENIAGDTANRRPLTEAIQEIVAATANTIYVPIREGFNVAGDTTNQGDFTHPGNEGSRALGADLDAALADTTTPTIATPATSTVPDGSPLAVTLSTGEYASAEILPGLDAASFEKVRVYGTGGVGNINAVHWDDILRFTGNAAASYATKSTYSVTIRMRDWARNLVDKVLTINVAQPYGVGDQGPVTLAYVGTYSISTDGSAQSGTQRFTIDNCPAGLLIAEFSSSGGNGDVSAVAIGGTAEKWQSVRGNANGGGSVHGIVNAQAGRVLLDATLSGGNGLAVDLTVQVFVATGTTATPSVVTRIEPALRNPPFETAALACPANGVILAIGACDPARRVAALGTAIAGPTGDRFGMYRITDGKLGYTISDSAGCRLVALTFPKSS